MTFKKGDIILPKTKASRKDWLNALFHAAVVWQEEFNGRDDFRGIIAILTRSSTDVRTYMKVLEEAGIPSVVRAGPDLFSQPEILLLVSALSISADMGDYLGSQHDPKSMPNRIKSVLGCEPEPLAAFRAAATQIRDVLPFPESAEKRLLLAADMLCKRIVRKESCDKKEIESLRSEDLKKFLVHTKFSSKCFAICLACASANFGGSASPMREAISDMLRCLGNL